MAGGLGIGPDELRGLTLRQLLWMAEGLGRERWAHTSLICSLIANANRDPKKRRPFKPADFNPYSDPRTAARQGDVIEVNGETIGIMRAAFTGQKGP